MCCYSFFLFLSLSWRLCGSVCLCMLRVVQVRKDGLRLFARTRAHACMHTLVRSRTHAHTHTRTHARTRTHTHARARARAHTHTHTHTHTQIYPHTTTTLHCLHACTPTALNSLYAYLVTALLALITLMVAEAVQSEVVAVVGQGCVIRAPAVLARLCSAYSTTQVMMIINYI